MINANNKKLNTNSKIKSIYCWSKIWIKIIGENKGSKFESSSGIKVFLFEELGKSDKVCVESLIKASDTDDLVIVDKHK